MTKLLSIAAIAGLTALSAQADTAGSISAVGDEAPAQMMEIDLSGKKSGAQPKFRIGEVAGEKSPEGEEVDLGVDSNGERQITSKPAASNEAPEISGLPVERRTASSRPAEKVSRKSGPTSLLSTYNLYSPAVWAGEDGSKRLFVGGFATTEDPTEYHRQLDAGADPAQIYGPDKIFTSPFSDSPQANSAGIKLALALKGYHVNDPTIVRPPSEPGMDRSQWLYMYFTMLDNRLAERCRKAGQGLLACPYLFEGHDLGFASSIDGGETWTFRGIVITAKDSGDAKGAWMPSVMKVNDELHLYYSTGRGEYSTPNIFRQKLKANGHEKIGKAEAVEIEGFAEGSQLHNIELLSYNGGERVLLTGNNGGWNALPLYESNDGLHFKQIAANLAVGEGGKVITPFLESAMEDSLACPAVVGFNCAKKSGPLNLRFLYMKQNPAGGWDLRGMEVNAVP